MAAEKTQSLEEVCVAKGMRMTEQRRVIARVLEAATDHPDVEELYRRASAVDPHISIATVYRTVKLFEDAGVIARHDFGAGRSRYETDPRRASRPPDRPAHRRGDRVPQRGDRAPAAGDRRDASASAWSITGSSSTACRSTAGRKDKPARGGRRGQTAASRQGNGPTDQSQAAAILSVAKKR